MPDSTTDKELRELATRFAKDFNIKYFKIKIPSHQRHISYRQESSYDYDGVTSNPALTIPVFIIKKHYNLINKGKIDELQKTFGEPSKSDDYFTVPAEYIDSRIKLLEGATDV